MTFNPSRSQTNAGDESSSVPSIEKRKSWKQKKFSEPKNTINVATLFSGIGAIEQALTVGVPALISFV